MFKECSLSICHGGKRLFLNFQIKVPYLATKSLLDIPQEDLKYSSYPLLSLQLKDITEKLI